MRVHSVTYHDDGFEQYVVRAVSKKMLIRLYQLQLSSHAAPDNSLIWVNGSRGSIYETLPGPHLETGTL